MKVLIIAALACVAAASRGGSYSYHGKYSDKCGNDGLYFRDDKSFVFCSNGNSYVQPCAPGSRNAAYDSYSHGKSYGYSDFCSVNLVDYGYGANGGHNNGYGYDRRGGYGGYDNGYGYGGYGDRSYGYGDRSYGYGDRSYGGFW